MQTAAADHLQPRAEARLVVSPIDGADDLAAGVVELQAVARRADASMRSRTPNSASTFIPLGATPRNPPSSPASLRRRSQTTTSMPTPQEQAQGGTRDSAPHDHDPADVSLRHASSDLLSTRKRNEAPLSPQVNNCYTMHHQQ
jgi:hypothetical protein